MLRHVFRRISPAGQHGRLSILIFHRVLAARDELFPDVPDAAAFDRIVGWLASWFNILPLDRACAMLSEHTLPERAAAITFDDGYADNHDVALPVLRRHRACATFFVATGYLDGGQMWNDTVIEAARAFDGARLDLTELSLGAHPMTSVEDRRRAIDAIIRALKYRAPPERRRQSDAIARIAGAQPAPGLMMTTAQVIGLHKAGMQIGAHTVSHPILAAIPDDEAREEIAGSRRHLELALGERVGLFAYPNGKPGVDYLDQHVAMVRSLGFDAAVSTAPGAAAAETDPMQLPRFTPWDRGRFAFGARLGLNVRRASVISPVGRTPSAC